MLFVVKSVVAGFLLMLFLCPFVDKFGCLLIFEPMLNFLANVQKLRKGLSFFAFCMLSLRFVLFLLFLCIGRFCLCCLSLRQHMLNTNQTYC